MIKKLKTINIKGKNYVQVVDRIECFRQEKEFDGWSIATEYEVSDDWSQCIVHARIRNPEGQVISTGIAHESQQSSYINKTSFVENAETSAIGRALGALGIGLTEEFASADEVRNATPPEDSSPQTENKPSTSKGTASDEEINKKLNVLVGEDHEKVNTWVQANMSADSYLVLPINHKREIIRRWDDFKKKVGI
jgi:hypothetical protein